MKTFYQKKIVKSNQLMEDLDRMTVERPHLMELKKHFIEHPVPIIDVVNQNHRIKDATDCYKEVKMNATIARL